MTRLQRFRRTYILLVDKLVWGTYLDDLTRCVGTVWQQFRCIDGWVWNILDGAAADWQWVDSQLWNFLSERDIWLVTRTFSRPCMYAEGMRKRHENIQGKFVERRFTGRSADDFVERRFIRRFGWIGVCGEYHGIVSILSFCLAIREEFLSYCRPFRVLSSGGLGVSVLDTAGIWRSRLHLDAFVCGRKSVVQRVPWQGSRSLPHSPKRMARPWGQLCRTFHLPFWQL